MSNLLPNSNLKLRKCDNIIGRKIHSSFFLVDICDNYENDKCALYEINESGMFIWNLINGENTIEDIASLLKAAIIDDVDFQTIYDDVLDFMDTLINKHFAEV